MRGSSGEANFIVGAGANAIVAGFEPFQSNQREPAIGLQKFRSVLGAPGSQIFLEIAVLGEERSCEQKTGKNPGETLRESGRPAHTQV